MDNSAGAAAAGLRGGVESSRACPARQEIRILLDTFRHLDRDCVDEVLECVLDVYTVFCAGLKELESETLGEVLTLVLRDHPALCQVTLVPHQHRPRVLPGEVLDCGRPAGEGGGGGREGGEGGREGGREGEEGREGGREGREGRGGKGGKGGKGTQTSVKRGSFDESILVQPLHCTIYHTHYRIR